MKHNNLEVYSHFTQKAENLPLSMENLSPTSRKELSGTHRIGKQQIHRRLEEQKDDSTEL